MKVLTLAEKQIHTIGTAMLLLLFIATMTNRFSSGHYMRFSVMEHFASYEVPALEVHMVSSFAWAVGSTFIIMAPKSWYHRLVGRTISLIFIIMVASGMYMSFNTLAHMDIKPIVDIVVTSNCGGPCWDNEALHLLFHSWSNLQIGAIAMCLFGLAIANAKLKDLRMHRNYFKTLNVWLAFNTAPRVISFLLRLIAPFAPKYQNYSVALLIHYAIEVSGMYPSWCMRVASVPAIDQRSIHLQYCFIYAKTVCVNLISLLILWHCRQTMPSSQFGLAMLATSVFSPLYLFANGYVSAHNKRNCVVRHMFVGGPVVLVTGVSFAWCIPSYAMIPLIAIGGLLMVLYTCWYLMDFQHRVARSSPDSPSHLRLPSLIARSGTSSNSSASKCPFAPASPMHKVPKKVERAPGIDMDHIYLSFTDFISTIAFIMPSVFLLFMKGFGSMYIRRALQRWGLLNDSRLTESHARKVVHKMFTGTPSLPPYLSSIESDDSGDEIATFVLDSMPLVRNSGEVYTANLRVQVSLGRQEMIDSKLDGRTLNARETFTIVSFFTVNTSHAKIHGLSNWGISLNEKTTDEAIWNGKITTIYNWMGYTIFPRLLLFLWSIGLLSINVKECHSIFDIGMDHGVPRHEHLFKLAKHSRVVSFLLKVRVHFEKEFKKYRHDFPEVDSAEGLFLNTIVHSMDHNILAELEHLWADETHPDFGGMAELFHLSRSAFVEDLPCLLFDPKLGAQTHPFYRAVYAHAMRIDPQLAENLDACIIK